MSGSDDLPVTRLTSKGQVTVPKALREKYDLEPGDQLVWDDRGEGLVVRKHSQDGRGVLAPDADEEARQQLVDDLFDDIKAARKRPAYNAGRDGEE
jgi:AbrB family looped-hinge helix DNA binding protein